MISDPTGSAKVDHDHVGADSTVQLSTHVAVVAEDAKTGRIAVFLQKEQEATPAGLSSMRSATAVDMVDDKKSRVCLAATRASGMISAVRLECVHATRCVLRTALTREYAGCAL
jgi:hypothetical protein